MSIVFPALIPSTRLFTPGDTPQAQIQSLSGIGTRYRRGGQQVGNRLALSFRSLTESDLLLLRDHYFTVQGTFQQFILSPEVWSGMSSPFIPVYGDFVWRYSTALTISSASCGRFDVEVELEAIPSILYSELIYDGGGASLSPTRDFIVDDGNASLSPTREVILDAGGAL